MVLWLVLLAAQMAQCSHTNSFCFCLPGKQMQVFVVGHDHEGTDCI